MVRGKTIQKARLIQRKPTDFFFCFKTALIMFFFLTLLFSMVFQATASTAITIHPVDQTVSAGDSFVVTIHCSPGQPLKAFELKLSYNPGILQATSVTQGDIFAGYATFFNPGVINDQAGTISNVHDLILGPGNVTNPGVLVTVHFTVKTNSGTSALHLYDVRMTNETAYVDITVSSASITVIGSPPFNAPSDDPPSPLLNTPPLVPLRPMGPTFIQIGRPYQYSSAAIDPDGDLVRLRFDWGDGTLSDWSDFVPSNTLVNASHAWMNVSFYPIRVIAQDIHGVNSSWSDALTVLISQTEQAWTPVIIMFHVQGNASAKNVLVFDASESYHPDGFLVSYIWEFGDGATGEGMILSYTYETSGNYTVTLTVTDAAGMSYSSSQLVSIEAGIGGLPEKGSGLLQSNEMMILLVGALAMVLIGLILYRYTTREISLLRRIEHTKRKLLHLDGDTAGINQIIDSLLKEMNLKRQTPRAETLLDVYNNLIVGLVEKNPATVLPDVNIQAVEDLIDRRIHATVAEQVDEM